MGPTGVRAKIPNEHETVLIIGDAASFAFVRSYGKKLRAHKNRVLYAGQFTNKNQVYCQAELEAAADVILWQTEDSDLIQAQRQQDYSTIGTDIVDTLIAYAANQLNLSEAISLADIDRVYVIGSTDLLRRFQAARQTSLKDHLLKAPKVVGAVYGNMQCMLKGVCAQCLQWQIDPETGERTKAVFACSWQDQPLEIIDIDHIDARQAQNHLLEQLNMLWIDHVFEQYAVKRV
jgi:hypothetical protein